MRSEARRLESHRRRRGSGSRLGRDSHWQSHDEERAPLVGRCDIAAMAARDLPDKRETKPTPLMPWGRLGAEAFLEDLPVDGFRNPGARIMDPDDELIVLLVHRHAHPPLVPRPARRLERLC